MKVGFIGLGNIGMPMCKNLLKAGFQLTVHNRSRGKVEEVAKLGAVPAFSPAEVTQATDIVLTCLPDVPTVEQVFLGEQGIVANARHGQVLVDHSTISPSAARRIAQAAEAQEAVFLDAPVSGGPERAEAGKISVVVGGDRNAYEKTLPVFQAVGSNIFHVGPSGMASAIKLVNNLLLAINSVGAAEAFNLGVRLGADPQVLLDIFGKSTGHSLMLDFIGPSMLKRKFVSSGRHLQIVLKDLGMVDEVAREMEVPIPLGDVAREVFRKAASGWPGNTNISTILLVLEELADTPGQGAKEGT